MTSRPTCASRSATSRGTRRRAAGSEQGSRDPVLHCHPERSAQRGVEGPKGGPSENGRGRDDVGPSTPALRASAQDDLGGPRPQPVSPQLNSYTGSNCSGPGGRKAGRGRPPERGQRQVLTRMKSMKSMDGRSGVPPGIGDSARPGGQRKALWLCAVRSSAVIDFIDFICG